MHQPPQYTAAHRHPTRTALHRLLFVCLALLLTSGFFFSTPAAATVSSTEHTAHSTALQAAVPIDPQLDHYSPNTTISWHDNAFWFTRPPYASRIIPRGDGTFIFESGWLQGRLMYFTRNESGGTSILLLSDNGSWNEFARSGEIYPDLGPELIGTLEHILERAVTNPDLPGAMLYVNIPGRGKWIGARGLADQASGMPMVPLDRFRIASITKPFVSVVVLQLAQEGKLSLDDTVERWMPRLVPNGQYMTIRQLLNHTSGLYDYLDNGFVNRVLRDPWRTWNPQELVSYAAVRPPYFSPGEPGRWRYSNTNYILLGMIVEHATGVSLEQQVRWRILESLGMPNTYFDPDDAISGLPIRGYVGSRDYTELNMSFAWGAGGMISTVDDLGTFAQAIARGALLNPEMHAAMHQFGSVHGSWGAHHLGYGLGLMQDKMGIGPGLDQQPRPEWQAIVQGHTGGLTGYRSAMWYMPSNGVTIVVGVNQMYYDPNIIVTDTMDAVLAHLDRGY